MPAVTRESTEAPSYSPPPIELRFARARRAEASIRPQRRLLIAFLAVIALAAALDGIVAGSMSPTSDEPDYLAYGQAVLRGQPDRSQTYWDCKTPISALNAAPRALASRLNPGQRAPLAKWLQSIHVARAPSVLATLLLDLFLGLWAYDLFGMQAALAAFILAAFAPNLIAHGTLATNDGYFALGVVAALYFFRRYLLDPSLKNAALSGLVLALAQITKSLAIYLYLVTGIFLVLAFLRRGKSGVSLSRRQIITYAATAIVCFAGVINLAYCFDRMFTPLRSYRFESPSFQKLQKLPVLGALPVPLPYPFLQGLDMMKFSDDKGVTYGDIYLLGERRDVLDPQFHNFKSYYLVAWFFKEPIALQILFALGLVWIWKHRRREQFIFEAGPLLAAAIVLVAWLSLFRKSQIGIRSVLPALAIEIVIAAAPFAYFAFLERRRKITLGLLALWLCISMLSYFPNLIPYFNEWAGSRTNTYRILADSNLDWGQDTRQVAKFLRHNPDVVLNPENPVAGRVLVSGNLLAGIYRQHKTLDWLRPYQPVGQVGEAHFLFVVPAHAQAKTIISARN